MVMRCNADSCWSIRHFNGIIDLLTRKMATFGEGEKGSRKDHLDRCSEEYKDQVEELRLKIVEKAVTSMIVLLKNF